MAILQTIPARLECCSLCGGHLTCTAERGCGLSWLVGHEVAWTPRELLVCKILTGHARMGLGRNWAEVGRCLGIDRVKASHVGKQIARKCRAAQVSPPIPLLPLETHAAVCAALGLTSDWDPKNLREGA